jgi:hypothetical protein
VVIQYYVLYFRVFDGRKMDKIALENLDITDEIIKRFEDEIKDNVFLRIITEVNLEKEVIQAVIRAILNSDN